MRSITAIAGATLLAACATAPSRNPIAVAVIRDAAGTEVATAALQEFPDGVTVALTVGRLPAGEHGVHVHAAGRCDAPDFTTAGGHHNPAGRQHGTRNPAGPHAGDLPNLTADGAGGGTFPGAQLPGESLASLLGGDGVAIVIHAGPDDLATDPSGGSGARIACGVLAMR